MKTVSVLVSVCLLSACSRSAPDAPAGAPTVPEDGRPHIPGMAQMTREDLNAWMRRCAPYQSSLEARSRNPYDPADCDEVVRRHTEWRTPSTQAPAAYLPGLH